MSTVLIDDDTGTLTYEIFLHQPYLHLDMKKGWSKETKLECYEHLEDIKQYFREEGYKAMYVGVPRDDKKLQKFLAMFGFDSILVNYNEMLYRKEII